MYFAEFSRLIRSKKAYRSRRAIASMDHFDSFASSEIFFFSEKNGIELLLQKFATNSLSPSDSAHLRA
jgi:hypothetical protein